jgi:hypothetical protein
MMFLTNPPHFSPRHHQVYYPPAAEMSSTSIPDILEFYKSKSKKSTTTDSQMAIDDIIGDVVGDTTSAKTLDLIIAAGPYTVDDNLQFQPFKELVDVVAGKKPDVVILMGPFLDYKHPLIESGCVDKFPNEYFKEFILAGVDKMRGKSEKRGKPGLRERCGVSE